MDPGTFDEARLAAFLDAGVTRVSVGVQSFDDELLKKAGRAHDAAATSSALELLRKAHAAPSSPLRSFSIDLIGGLPYQTREAWQRSLRAAATCGAQHVSVYDLQVEPGTAYGKWYESGEGPLPEEEVAADMYRDAVAVLGGAGFEHYEVSNYARAPHHRSRHNLEYWSNGPFLGFGLGATSHLYGVRLPRPRTMAAYADFVAGLEEDGGFARAQEADGVAEEGREALTTRLMLALRTRAGVREAELEAAFGADLAHAAAAACADAAAELPAEWIGHSGADDDASAEEHARATGTDGGGRHRLALSDPEGLLFSNEAIATVFAKLDSRLDGRAASAAEPDRAMSSEAVSSS